MIKLRRSVVYFLDQTTQEFYSISSGESYPIIWELEYAKNLEVNMGMDSEEVHFIQYEQVEASATRRNLQNSTTSSISKVEGVALDPIFSMFFVLSHIGGTYIIFSLLLISLLFVYQKQMYTFESINKYHHYVNFVPSPYYPILVAKTVPSDLIIKDCNSGKAGEEANKNNSVPSEKYSYYDLIRWILCWWRVKKDKSKLSMYMQDSQRFYEDRKKENVLTSIIELEEKYNTLMHNNMLILQRMHVKGSRFRRVKTLIDGEMNINLRKLHKQTNNAEYDHLNMMGNKTMKHLLDKKISDFKYTKKRPTGKKENRKKFNKMNTYNKNITMIVNNNINFNKVQNNFMQSNQNWPDLNNQNNFGDSSMSKSNEIQIFKHQTSLPIVQKQFSLPFEIREEEESNDSQSSDLEQTKRKKHKKRSKNKKSGKSKKSKKIDKLILNSSSENSVPLKQKNKSRKHEKSKHRKDEKSSKKDKKDKKDKKGSKNLKYRKRDSDSED